MKVKNIKFSKKGRPKRLVLELSVDEAGVIAKVMGRYSSVDFEKDFPNLMREETHAEIYYSLTGEFFNRYYDDGVEGWMNGEAPASKPYGGL